MPASVEMYLLGGFRVVVDERPVHQFESAKARALLSYLAASGKPNLTREHLAGLFWADSSESRARHNLSQTLYALRNSLNHVREEGADRGAPLLRADRHQIGFHPACRLWLDVTEFRSRSTGCRAHAPDPDPECSHCVSELMVAVELYRGELLAGLSLGDCHTFEEWLLLKRETLHRRAQSAMAWVATWQRERGNLEEALGTARRAVALDPLWEPAQRQLIHCLWLTGRRAEALAQVERLRELLARDLGLQPDRQTERLVQRIQAEPEGVSPRAEWGHNLPHHTTPFIGRRDELAQIESLLTSPGCRLLTVVGLGGSGKTRLALEAARRLSAHFPDGIFLVPLSGVSGRAALPFHIAENVSLTVDQERPVMTQLLDFLREKRLLLLLDSFEQLADGAEVVVDILRGAPRVTVLATSRVRLNLKGEHLYPLGGLAVPDGTEAIPPESEAIALFLSASERVRAGYRPDGAELAEIAGICRRLDGLPLALILAAGWLRMLSPAMLARQLERNLDYLAADWPDLPARQRSLRATLNYSWDLLDRRQRRLAAALSVFRGGFTLTAAQSVTDASPRELRALIEHSLVQQTGGERYAIHDLVREYAAEKVAESPGIQKEVNRRHSRHYLAHLAEAAGALKRPGQQESLTLLDEESGNIAAAWKWAVEDRDVAGLEAALDGLALYLELRCRFQEGEAACRAAALAGPPTDNRPGLDVRARNWQARFCRELGDHGKARELLQANLTELDGLAARGINERRERAFLLLELGHVWEPNDRETAGRFYAESLDIYRDVSEWWWVARVLTRQGRIAHLRGEHELALALHEESLDFSREMGDPRATAAALVELGHNALRLNRLAEGEQYIQASIEHFTMLNDRAGAARSELNLARLFYWVGRMEEMPPLLDASQAALRDLGLREEAAFAMSVRALASGHLARYDQAWTEAQESLAYARQWELPRYVAMSLMTLAQVAIVRREYDEAQQILARCEKICREIEQMEELATALLLQGCLALDQGAPSDARPLLAEALAICIRTRSMYSVFHTVPIVARYLAEAGDLERAVETYALVIRYPPARFPMNEDLAGRHIRALAADLPRELVAAAQERGRSLDLWETMEALRDLLR